MLIMSSIDFGASSVVSVFLYLLSWCLPSLSFSFRIVLLVFPLYGDVVLTRLVRFFQYVSSTGISNVGIEYRNLPTHRFTLALLNASELAPLSFDMVVASHTSSFHTHCGLYNSFRLEYLSCSILSHLCAHGLFVDSSHHTFRQGNPDISLHLRMACRCTFFGLLFSILLCTWMGEFGLVFSHLYVIK